MTGAAVLIPAFPLAGFLILLAAGRRIGRPGAGVLATAMMAGAFLSTFTAFLGLLARDAEDRGVTYKLFEWIPALHIDVSILVDPLSLTMALFVTGVGMLIHLYAVGYMSHDERFHVFFTYLNMFAFAMLILVLADNYLLMFVGWEGVGACSYFLISFWFTRNSAAVAGKKAFVTNRVGDVGMLLAMFMLLRNVGSLNYHEVFEKVHGLSTGTATVIVLLLLVGAAGKSAQLPLYVWLPDAMEGPTPVSALIHAATMVTAGVYLMVRSNALLHLAPDAMTVIAVVGVATAFFAATIACAQNDIKRVLAYSTISQLGFMFLAIGSGAYVAAVFHMVTHAFFKALMFLGAGSVIHGLGDEQDMKRMGNLRKYMPITTITFLIGWLAIAGIPPFAGFWSKDEILLAAYEKHILLWVAAGATAILTAYYMSRQVFLVFYGDERYHHDGEHDVEAEHNTEGEQHAEGGQHAEGAHHGDPHESPPVMWIPLAVLAALSVLGGLLNLPFSHSTELLLRWLEPIISAPHGGDTGSTTKVLLAAVPFLGSVAAIFFARRWATQPDQPQLEPAVLQKAWGVDAAYAAAVAGPGNVLANAAADGVDRKFIDGAVNGVATLVGGAGERVRKLQTGYIRNYALGITFGAVALIGWVVTRVTL